MATPSLGTDLRVETIARDSLEKIKPSPIVVSSQYTPGRRLPPLPPSPLKGKQEYSELLQKLVVYDNQFAIMADEILKLKTDLVNMTNNRDCWRRAYASVPGLYEAFFKDTEKIANYQPKIDHVFHAINKIGKDPHASRYSVIENGELN